MRTKTPQMRTLLTRYSNGGVYRGLSRTAFTVPMTTCAIGLVLTLSSTARGHGGNANVVAWEVCADGKLGDRCEFVGHHDKLHRGSCRSFDGKLMCVRSKPLISVSVSEATKSSGADTWSVAGAWVKPVLVAIGALCLFFLFRFVRICQRKHQYAKNV